MGLVYLPTRLGSLKRVNVGKYASPIECHGGNVLLVILLSIFEEANPKGIFFVGAVFAYYKGWVRAPVTRETAF